jgi:two-component system nitrate/nitrite response regulator NarL
MRLLICDAHERLLDSLSMALMGNGYTVVATASDLDEAVAAAREHRPDVCLLDVSFPHTKGLSAIARIHEASADTKVVMLGGSIDGGLLAGAMPEGAQGLVGEEKPIRSVVQALEMAFQRHLPVDPQMLQEILRPRDAADRRNTGRPDRRDPGRPDRRDGGRPDDSDVRRPDRRNVGRPDRRDSGRPDRRDVDRQDR